MATLLLQAAGQAAGSFLGGPLGAIAGRAIGAIAGNLIDQRLFGPKPRHTEGPRLKEIHLMGAGHGAPIPRVFGRMRVAGQLIWATRFEEVATTTTRRAGGKGGMTRSKAKVTEYSYFGNFAVALCEGEINRIGRVWADGKELDISRYVHRVYTGSTDQHPDSLIIAKQGTPDVPAYRGLAYVVFENLPLERFGNRLPNLSFEVFRALDDVESQIRAVNIIPGATEFGLDTIPVRRDDGWGGTITENTHMSATDSDWTVSMDQLQATLPNVQSASLVVSWFGDDLRCGQTQIKPGAENAVKVTAPRAWNVAGLTRTSAHQISQTQNGVAYGSTPDDQSVINAVRDLHERGIAPVVYPFILLDIPAGNTLADPYGAASQPAYPWRGRITCHPAPGQPGTPDKTAAIHADVDAFFGTVTASDFDISSGSIVYSGPNEWTYTRMVLHNACLCALAGGVEAFLLGSELVQLTRLRDDTGAFPAVNRLIALAGEVATILPTAKISYAADWSEYFGDHPQDGSGDVFFHLDDLWASPHVDFVGIDYYMPLSDWRDGVDHLDAMAGTRSIYDLDYLKANMAGGEGFDWYYASKADRDSQIRSPITDGAFNRPWVFRYKDLVSWWSNVHYNRPGGVESTTPTAWQPMSKPVRLTEAGCPAVDRGTNQPNVFFDAKSAESQLPYHSRGQRDDFIQRRYIRAMSEYWAKTGAHNPVSPTYGGPMVDVAQISYWAWDARPFPAFPHLTDVWSDGVNYARGHWLNGRMGAASLAALVANILERFGFTDFDTTALEGVVDGYVIDKTMSARAAIEPLAALFSFDAVETGGRLVFRHHNGEPTMALASADFVELRDDKPVFSLNRGQETELPNRLQTLFIDPDNDYSQAVAEAVMLTGQSRRDQVTTAPVALSQSIAEARTEQALHAAWTARETLECTLPPSLVALDPGDTFGLELDGQPRILRISETSLGNGQKISAHEISSAEPAPQSDTIGEVSFKPRTTFGPPLFEVMDLAIAGGEINAAAPFLAARSSPWPGRLDLVENNGAGFEQIGEVDAPAVLGRLTTALARGPASRFDNANSFEVELASGELASVTDRELFAGANLAAIGDAASGWELIQFRDAQLTDPRTYRLSGLLRALAGSAAEMLASRPVDTRFVLLNGAVGQIPTQLEQIGLERSFRLGPAGRDHGDASYLDFTHAPKGLGLRPLAPVHLKATATPGGLLLSWIRQSRLDADSWALADIPLGEDSEAYTLRILDNAIALRTLELTQPHFVYTDADREADFGLPLPATLTFEVAQKSAIWGNGTFKEITTNV